MKKRLISLITSAAMLVMLLAGLKLEAYAKTYTITYDPNGGTPGQGFVETEQVTLSDTTQESWFTPYYHEEDVAPPAGAVFDGYDVNGQRVAAVTAVLAWLTGLGAVLALIGCGIAAYWLYRVQKKEFGGMSGDLSGYFLQLAELFMLMGLLTAQAMI